MKIKRECGLDYGFKNLFHNLTSSSREPQVFL